MSTITANVEQEIGAKVDAALELTTTLVIDAAIAAVAFGNAAQYASPARHRPVLNCVRLEVNADGVRLVATDSYALIVQRVTADVTGASDRAFLIPATACADFAKAARKVKYGPVVVKLTADGGVGVDSWQFVPSAGVSMGGACYDGTFPNYAQLIPRDETLTGTGPDGIALGMFQLARLAKTDAMPDETGTSKRKVAVPVRFAFNTALKPCLAHVGRYADVLVMPVKVGS